MHCKPDLRMGKSFHMSYGVGGTLVEEMSTITFIEEEAKKVFHPHDDALVVTVRVGHNNVHYILIDGGSSIIIMCKSTFHKMGLTANMLKLSLHHYMGLQERKSYLREASSCLSQSG